MSITNKISAIAASGALALTGFAPVYAAPVSAPAVAAPVDMSALAWNSEGQKAQRYGRYGRYRGYGRYGRYRHRNRVDAGDVLAGVLIIGGIAAIASAASKNKRDRRYEDRDYKDRDYRDNRRYESRSDDRYNRRAPASGTGDMDLAINACSNAAEVQAGNDARVDEIRSVTRDGSGWRIEGNLSGASQSNFLCGATDGRVDYVQFGDGRLALRY